MASRNNNTMLNVEEIARILNVHINTVRRWSNNGIIKTYRIGPRGDRRFRKEDVALFLEEHRGVANPMTHDKV